MTTKEIVAQIAKQAKQLETLARRNLPIKVGRLAKNHYQDNFRQGGFVNGGLKPWQRSKRQSGTGTSAGYGTLMSDRRHLFNSVQYTPSDNSVRIHNDAIHAPIHNWGGTVTPTVTPKMRRFAWAKYYEATSNTSEAKMWKGLALTKKTKLSIEMPQRQFIGESAELNEKVAELIKTEVSNIINK